MYDNAQLEKETGKSVTTQDIINMKYTYKSRESDVAESIAILNEEFEGNPGSSLRIIYESQNEELDQRNIDVRRNARGQKVAISI